MNRNIQKWQIIACGILLCYINGRAQIFTFKSTAIQWTVRDDKGAIIHRENRDEVGIPIIINYDSAEVDTKGQQPIHIKLFVVLKRGKDSEENQYQSFGGTDQAGQKCAVVFTILHEPFSSGAVALLDISYPRQDLLFELAK